MQEASRPTLSPGSRYTYLQPEQRRQIHNFDDFENLKTLTDRLDNGYSKDFFIDFGLDEAWCGFDLEASAWQKLLQARTTKSDPRWIQIWCPHKHQELIKDLATRYELSPRLTELMLTKPHGSEFTHSKVEIPHTPRFQPWRSPKAPFATATSSSDEERGRVTAGGIQNNGSIPSPRRAVPPPPKAVDELDHYDIADSIWHLQSVDVGRKHMCLGYNTLYDVKPNMKGPKEGESLFAGDLPDARRVWQWIMICDDNMVVSITESIMPSASSVNIGTPALRDNLRNVFRQLSKANDHPKQNSISVVPIRKIMDREKNTSSGAGLLLYYLFDDWMSTFGLLARRDNAYSTKLNGTRRSMMEKADLRHVELLHRLGRQMAVLRRLYMSYQLIVAKVLERHKGRHSPLEKKSASSAADDFASMVDTQSFPSTQQSHTVSGLHRIAHQPSSSSLHSRTLPDTIGTYLSASAMDRFERLGDRISLLVLTEIEESIALKDQLLAMSDSVERLTRITILLAKVTILVLPVTLMTGYFSVQIPNTGFTITKYWISFAVILIFSFLGLIFFGQVSKTVEGGLVYKTFFGALLFLPKRLKLFKAKRRDNKGRDD